MITPTADEVAKAVIVKILDVVLIVISGALIVLSLQDLKGTR